MNWYFSRNGQQAGPIPLEALQNMYATGQVQPNDLVWTEGMPQWLPAASVPAVTGAGAAPAPAPQVSPMGYYNPNARGSGANFRDKAKTAMILGILSLTCCGFFTGIPALIIGNNAMKNMKSSGNLDGHGMAMAGFVMGIISIAWTILVIMVNIAKA